MASSISRFAKCVLDTRHYGSRVSDGDLLLPFAVLWLVSLARVLGAVLRHEVFGAEATLALRVVALLPWVALCSRQRGD